MPLSFEYIRANCLFFVLISLLGCKEITWNNTSTNQSSIGEAVYEIIYGGVSRSQECKKERLEFFASQRGPFVDSVDSMLPESLRLPMNNFVRESFVPLVDSNQLPPLTQATATLLQILIDDELDPERKKLSAILNLSQTKSVLQAKHFFVLAESMLEDPRIREIIQALGGLALEHNEVDFAINEFFGILSKRLESYSEPSQCTGLALGNLEATILREDLLPNSVDHGQPAWLVRSDIYNNPRVAKDPNTGKLHLPYIDFDSNGAADINEAGQPIDVQGREIRILPIGTEGHRDAYGRALTSTGDLLFDYFDTKRTGLAMLAILIQQALEYKTHHHLVTLTDSILGQPTNCPNLDDYCEQYTTDDHPIADLVFVLAEIARYDNAQELLNTWSKLLNENNRLAEDIFVAIGQVIERLDGSDISLSNLEMIELIQEALPLISDLFETPNSTGSSTGRLLMSLLHDLGNTARNVPQQLQMTIDYSSLYKEEACTDTPVDLARSTPVDYNLPRRYLDSTSTLIDNRSSLERSIELFSSVDCGSVPLTGGKTVATFVLETIADMQPDTVCNSIDSLLNIVGIFPWMGETVSTVALDAIGCDGDLVWRDLQTIDSLAKSGALDTYIPIAKVFVDRNQVETLLGLFHLVSNDLRKEDDQNETTRSVIRKSLPHLSDIIQSGAIEKVFDLDDLLVTVPAVDSDGTAADVIVDSIERLLVSNSPVSTRRGLVLGSSLASETLKPVHAIFTRISNQEAQEAVTAIRKHFTGYVTQTEVDDQDTADPRDDRVVLENKRFLPLIQIILDSLIELLELPDNERHCYFTSFQTSSNEYLTTGRFADDMRMLRTLKNSPHGRPLEDAIVNYLQPNPDATTPDIMGPILQILSGVSQISARDEDTQHLVSFLAQTLNPTQLNIREAILALNDLLELDERDFFLNVLRNSLHQGDRSLEDAPIYTIGSSLMTLASIEPLNQCLMTDKVWTVSDLEPHLATLVEFITDNDYGLGAIWRIIRARRGGATTYE